MFDPTCSVGSSHLDLLFDLLRLVVCDDWQLNEDVFRLRDQASVVRDGASARMKATGVSYRKEGRACRDGSASYKRPPACTVSMDDWKFSSSVTRSPMSLWEIEMSLAMAPGSASQMAVKSLAAAPDNEAAWKKMLSKGMGVEGGVSPGDERSVRC